VTTTERPERPDLERGDMVVAAKPFGGLWLLMGAPAWGGPLVGWYAQARRVAGLERPRAVMLGNDRVGVPVPAVEGEPEPLPLTACRLLRSYLRRTPGTEFLHL
jgi:hypothetical protein